MLKLKLQYFSPWCKEPTYWKMLEGIGGKRRRGQQMMRWLCSIIHSIDMNLSKLQGIVEDSGDWHAAVHGVVKIRHDLVTEQKQSEFLA